MAAKTLTTAGPKDKVIPIEYRGWLPDALAAACHYPGEYALGLRDGTILSVDTADYEPGSEWVHVCTATGLRDFPAGTGMDIRVADITWAADVAVRNE